MTLNVVMALTLSYFTEFGEPAFQLITASSSIEVIDQKSARAVKLVCVTKFTHSRVEWISSLLSFNLSFKFRFTVVMLSYCGAWLPVYSKQCVPFVCAGIYARVYLYSVVRVRYRRKKLTFAISSPDELSALH